MDLFRCTVRTLLSHNIHLYMRIGIDIDEVLADMLTAIIEFHNETYGTAVMRGDVVHYLGDVLGDREEECTRKIFEFFETDHFAAVAPVAGAFPALRILKDLGHELVVITARPESISAKTQAWVDRYYPELFSGIYFGNRHAPTGDVRTKSQLCLAAGADVLIEDDLYHANECAANGIAVLLFDYPWNQGVLPDRVQRVFSWDDVIRMVS